MSGDLFAVLVATLEVVVKAHPELLQEIQQRVNHYRQYVFPDGADIFKGQEHAYKELIPTIYNV